MREIKFRAWIAEDDNMIALGELFCWEHGYHNPEFVKILGEPLTEKNLGLISTDNKKYQDESRKRFVLMQYTGRKDKNGKEIYEDDLVRNFHQGDNQPFIYNYTAGRIKFNNGKWSVCQDKLGSTPLTDYIYPKEEHCEVEVIGNIYQDPHLNYGSDF